MTIRIVCPQCKTGLKTAKEPAVGAQLKCPKCQLAFRYAPEVAADSKVAPQAAAESKPDESGSRWPLVLALLALVLVVGGTGYVMREPIRELLAKTSDDGESEKPSTKSSESTSVSKTPKTTTETGQSRQESVGRAAIARTGQQPDRTTIIKLPATFQVDTIFSDFAFSSDRKTMAAVSDASVQLWDLKAGKKTKTLAESSGYDLRLLVAPDGKVLAVAAHTENSWTCTLYSLPGGNEIAKLQWEQPPDDGESVFTRETYAPPMKFSPSSDLFAVPSDNNSVVVWNVKRREEQTRLAGHTGRIDDIVFTSDSKRLIASSGQYDHQSIRIWSLDDGEGHELAHGRHAFDVLISTDSKVLISRSFDQISVWNLADDQRLQLNYTH